MQAGPQVVWLVTSRARLNLRAERALLLEGLPLPPTDDEPQAADYPSVALYLANSGLVVGDPVRPLPDLRGIVRLCRVCAGLPLAIELAAVQAMWKSPAALAAELSADLSCLDAAAPDLPAAHRSLRAVFERSWRLLGPDEQAGLARLAVFQGGFTPEAAAAVTGASPAGLAALAYKTALRLDPLGRYDFDPRSTSTPPKSSRPAPMRRRRLPSTAPTIWRCWPATRRIYLGRSRSRWWPRRRLNCPTCGAPGSGRRGTTNRPRC